MTTVNRALTAPVARQYSLGNVSVTNNNGIVPLRLSRARTTLYGLRKTDNALMQSQDKGSTWTFVYTFPADRPITGVVEMANGECLVMCTLSAGTQSYIYRSTGWSTTAATRPSATWALVLTTTGGQLPGKWTAHQWTAGNNGVVVVATYGTPTAAGGAGSNITTAHYLYVSEDFGATWSLRYDLYTGNASNQTVGVHFHGVAYHEQDDRLYASYGDNMGGGYSISGSAATKQQLMYSDDRGLTWAFFDIPSDYANFINSAAMQFTTIGVALDGSLILQTDGKPYFLCVLKRTGYRTYGAWHLQVPQGPGGNSTIGANINRDNATGPFFTTYELNGNTSGGLSAASNNRSMAITASEDGLNWHTMYVDTPRRIVSPEYWGLNLMGPTPDGKVVGSYGYKNGGAWADGSLFVADLIGPA